MLIGVISDTHIPDRASKIPENVMKIFEGVDIILHAGDLTEPHIKEDLETLAPTYCVQGNMDRAYGHKLPKSKLIEIEGVRLGLNHGEVYPRGDTQQLKYIAMELDVEVLITGHTHWAFVKQVGDLLLLNPGSPTVPRLSDPTVMLLEIDNGEIDAQIVKIGNPICKALNFPGTE